MQYYKLYYAEELFSQNQSLLRLNNDDMIVFHLLLCSAYIFQSISVQNQV